MKIQKTKEEIKNILLFKITSLRNKIQECTDLMKKDNLDKTKIQALCGEVASILYVLYIDTGNNRNISLLHQYGIKDKFWISKTGTTMITHSINLEDGVKLPVGEIGAYKNTGKIFLVHGCNLYTVGNDNIVPVGYNAQFIKTVPPREYLSSKIEIGDLKIKRNDLLNYFRSNFTGHIEPEYDSIYESKKYQMISLNIENLEQNMKECLSLEACMIQIGVEFVKTFDYYLAQRAFIF